MTVMIVTATVTVTATQEDGKSDSEVRIGQECPIGYV